MHFFAIYRKTVTALYAYEIRQNAGCLVCTLFAGCGSVPGVRLVYALFLFFCLLPRCPASVCTFLRKKKKHKKEMEKRGGKDMHITEEKRAA